MSNIMSNSRMNSELRRLSTFSSWQSDTIVEPASLANAGFYATGTDLEVICHWCQKKISDWKLNDRPMERHRRMNPVCPFVLEMNNCDNIPIQTDGSEEIDNKPVGFDSQSTGSEFLPDLKNEQFRLNTFQNWPLSYITPSSLARAGFYYFNSADRVKCAWCNIVVGQWEIGDNPFSEHQRLVPTCAKVQLGPNLEIASNGIRDLGIQKIRPPKEPRFSSLDARLRSFADWERGNVQNPENLAHAGFYYQGLDDQVRCFQCNGGLRYWMVDDDPWFEHARWFPTCQFVHLVKGGSYIKSVQDKPHCDSSMAEIPQQIMTLDDAMCTEHVQSVLSMGLNVGRIRSAVKIRLEKTGKPFQNAESLIEAVLDGQIEEEDLSDETNTGPPIPPLSTNRRRNITYYSYESPSQRPATTTSTDYISTYQMETKNQTSIEVDKSKSVEEEPNTSKSITKDKLEVTSSLSLEEENRKLKDARTCKICMDAEVGVVFLPCGHLVTCVQCAPGVTMCPLCRSSIKGFVRTFLS